MLTDVVISAKSSNGKTGPMPTISRPIVTRDGVQTCPSTCAFLPAAMRTDGTKPAVPCYANGRINGTVRKFAADVPVSDAVAKINAGKARDARYIRDRVVGDIARPDGTADLGYLAAVADVAAQTGLTAYGYTHAYRSLSASDVAAVAASGYVLNASCNTAADVADAVALGMPTTYAGDDIADGDVIAGRRVITCPEQTGRVESCAACGLCAKPNRAVTVRFLMH